MIAENGEDREIGADAVEAADELRCEARIVVEEIAGHGDDVGTLRFRELRLNRPTWRSDIKAMR